MDKSTMMSFALWQHWNHGAFHVRRPVDLWRTVSSIFGVQHGICWKKNSARTSFVISLDWYCTVTAFGAPHTFPGVLSACSLHGMHPGIRMLCCQLMHFLFDVAL